MPEIKPEQLLLIAGFILPGAISMFVYALKIPQKEFDLKDRIAEAICFSLLNFIIVWALVDWLRDLPVVRGFGVLEWLVLVLAFVVLPALWPFGLVRLLQAAEDRSWIAVRAKTAWDAFFERQRSNCWVQVVLADGRTVGGRYGEESYVSSWPDPGDLYIEELWKIDEDGYFSEPESGQPGLLLRPLDYKMIQVYEGVVG